MYIFKSISFWNLFDVSYSSVFSLEINNIAFSFRISSINSRICFLYLYVFVVIVVYAHVRIHFVFFASIFIYLWLGQDIEISSRYLLSSIEQFWDSTKWNVTIFICQIFYYNDPVKEILAQIQFGHLQMIRIDGKHEASMYLLKNVRASAKKKKEKQKSMTMIILDVSIYVPYQN